MSRIRSQYYITRSRKAGDENEVKLVVSSPVVVNIQPSGTYPHGPSIYVTNDISDDVDCDDTSAYDAMFRQRI